MLAVPTPPHTEVGSPKSWQRQIATRVCRSIRAAGHRPSTRRVDSVRCPTTLPVVLYLLGSSDTGDVSGGVFCRSPPNGAIRDQPQSVGDRVSGSVFRVNAGAGERTPALHRRPAGRAFTHDRPSWSCARTDRLPQAQIGRGLLPAREGIAPRTGGIAPQPHRPPGLATPHPGPG
jgi:hypothetical protein